MWSTLRKYGPPLTAITVTILLVNNHGYADLTAITLGIAIYIIAKWVIEIIDLTYNLYKQPGDTDAERAVHWGHSYSAYRDDNTTCGNCGGYARRLYGDFYITCKRCGWKQGRPILRWINHSILAKSVRHEITFPRLALVFIILAGVSTGVLTGMELSGATESVAAAGETAASQVALTPAERSTNTRGSQSESSLNNRDTDNYDIDIVRNEFLRLLNDARENRDLPRLIQRSILRGMGQEQAENMAAHEYVGHTQPDGTTMHDRYKKYGLYDECRLNPQNASETYYGAENAAGSYVDRRMSIGDTIIYVSSEADLARALFLTWMNSPPHRDVLFSTNAETLGLGLVIKENGNVYAAVEFC